jgi:protein associated with RNAse G/E
MTSITVEKRNYKGETVIRYDGVIIDQGDTWVCLRAIFERKAANLGFVTFQPGDVFIEWFYTNRWYNIFQVHEGNGPHLRGWYCNITRPAEISDNRVVADDLELDVFVMPNGAVILLDEEEFSALELPIEERMAALRAIETIRSRVSAREAPFDLVG